MRHKCATVAQSTGVVNRTRWSLLRGRITTRSQSFTCGDGYVASPKTYQGSRDCSAGHPGVRHLRKQRRTGNRTFGAPISDAAKGGSSTRHGQPSLRAQRPRSRKCPKPRLQMLARHSLYRESNLSGFATRAGVICVARQCPAQGRQASAWCDPLGSVRSRRERLALCTDPASTLSPNRFNPHQTADPLLLLGIDRP
jgi:hypothetical protein